MSDELYGPGFSAGFAAGKVAMDAHYRTLYGDDFEAENKALRKSEQESREVISRLYKNHGHGTYDEACLMWSDIIDKGHF